MNKDIPEKVALGCFLLFFAGNRLEIVCIDKSTTTVLSVVKFWCIIRGNDKKEARKMGALEEKILKLKQEKNAVIMAHYYVPDEVQAIAG